MITMTDHEKVILQTYAIAKVREEAERAMIQEYACSSDAERLLHQRIYEIIACTANAAIDVAAMQPAPPPRVDIFEWHRENASRTEKRLYSDILFNRLVQSQTQAICEEVSLYRRGMEARRAEAEYR